MKVELCRDSGTNFVRSTKINFCEMFISQGIKAKKYNPLMWNVFNVHNNYSKLILYYIYDKTIQKKTCEVWGLKLSTKYIYID